MKKILVATSLLAGMAVSHAAEFALTSTDIRHASTIAKSFEFNGFGCNGENKSPELTWSNPPKGTQSFAITVYDPDAPTGSGWWHWMVVNIPANISTIKSDAGKVGGTQLPTGAAHVRIDFGYSGWGGVCPPAGDKAHRYIFTVHALKIPKLELPADATAALGGYMIRGNQLAMASFTATYGR